MADFSAEDAAAWCKAQQQHLIILPARNMSMTLQRRIAGN